MSSPTVIEVSERLAHRIIPPRWGVAGRPGPGATVMTACALLVSRRRGNPIEGVTGVADMVGLMVALTVGMLVAAAAVGPGQFRSTGKEPDQQLP
jgi:hypothetical protein